MTIPYERTKAVIETRELLQLLASSDGSAMPCRIHDLARHLLRHFPLNVDLDVSAAVLPNIWATVKKGTS
ncbi:BPSL0761 family protein [Paraburkholderia tropica]|uniref:BPSL0761 family protein n=1 Tax=Paraburkholderia tropica TaxID=92647 RepID=UPI0009F5C1A8